GRFTSKVGHPTARAKRAKSGIGDSHSLKSLAFSFQCFIEAYATKQFYRGRNHFPLLVQISGNSHWLSTDKHTADSGRTRRQLMRTVSFILAFAFILAGPSM